jgi:RNA polymerase sigma factor (sigma-70 family)
MLRRNNPLSDPGPLIERVYSYAAYRLGPGPDAEDVTSDTIERALRYVRSYDPKAGSVQAWLLGIARRVIDDHLTRAGRHSLQDVEAQNAPDDGMAIASIERLTLRTALASLTSDERDLLALRYGADLAARDIARIMGARTNAVEVALHRTLTKLRQSIDASSPAQARDRERA